MLSRTIRRALLDAPGQLPPTFLLPWAAGLSTVSHGLDPSAPPPSFNATLEGSREPPHKVLRPSQEHDASLSTIATSLAANGSAVETPARTHNKASSLTLSESVRELLPLLQSQAPHYLTAHIHGNPYVLTQGDTLRLPFLMHGVEPGDTLRLDRAVNLGSRDYTLKAPAAAPKVKSPAYSSTTIVDPTSGTLTSHSRVMPTDNLVNEHAPHFIPHIAKGKFAYLNSRLFVCRAVVTGVESEPMRTKEKTKRRQRHVRKVKSKHRFTILKIKELRVRSLEEIDGDLD